MPELLTCPRCQQQAWNIMSETDYKCINCGHQVMLTANTAEQLNIAVREEYAAASKE